MNYEFFCTSSYRHTPTVSSPIAIYFDLFRWPRWTHVHLYKQIFTSIRITFRSYRNENFNLTCIAHMLVQFHISTCRLIVTSESHLISSFIKDRWRVCTAGNVSRWWRPQIIISIRSILIVHIDVIFVSMAVVVPIVISYSVTYNVHISSSSCFDVLGNWTFSSETAIKMRWVRSSSVRTWIKLTSMNGHKAAIQTQEPKTCIKILYFHRIQIQHFYFSLIYTVMLMVKSQSKMKCRKGKRKGKPPLNTNHSIKENTFTFFGRIDTKNKAWVMNF